MGIDEYFTHKLQYHKNYMIDHVSISVSNLETSRNFYRDSLAPLGYAMVYDIEDVANWNVGINGCSIGENGETRLWLDGDNTPAYVHIAFKAATREVVDAWHVAAVAAGGKDNGAPGVREQYGPSYYAGFVMDPDGNNVEVVCKA